MRWFALGLALTAGCASTIPFPPLPPPTSPIWIGLEHSGEEMVCVDLFEPDGALKFACLKLKTIRQMANKIGVSD